MICGAARCEKVRRPTDDALEDAAAAAVDWAQRWQATAKVLPASLTTTGASVAGVPAVLGSEGAV